MHFISRKTKRTLLVMLYLLAFINKNKYIQASAISLFSDRKREKEKEDDNFRHNLELVDQLPPLEGLHNPSHSPTHSILSEGNEDNNNDMDEDLDPSILMDTPDNSPQNSDTQDSGFEEGLNLNIESAEKFEEDDKLEPLHEPKLEIKNGEFERPMTPSQNVIFKYRPHSSRMNVIINNHANNAFKHPPPLSEEKHNEISEFLMKRAPPPRKIEKFDYVDIHRDITLPQYIGYIDAGGSEEKHQRKSEIEAWILDNVEIRYNQIIVNPHLQTINELSKQREDEITYMMLTSRPHLNKWFDGRYHLTKRQVESFIRDDNPIKQNQNRKDLQMWMFKKYCEYIDRDEDEPFVEPLSDLKRFEITEFMFIPYEVYENSPSITDGYFCCDVYKVKEYVEQGKTEEEQSERSRDFQIWYEENFRELLYNEKVREEKNDNEWLKQWAEQNILNERKRKFESFNIPMIEKFFEREKEEHDESFKIEEENVKNIFKQGFTNFLKFSNLSIEKGNPVLDFMADWIQKKTDEKDETNSENDSSDMSPDKKLERHFITNIEAFFNREKSNEDKLFEKEENEIIERLITEDIDSFIEHFHHLSANGHIVPKTFEKWLKNHDPDAEDYVKGVLQEMYTDFTNEQNEKERQTKDTWSESSEYEPTPEQKAEDDFIKHIKAFFSRKKTEEDNLFEEQEKEVMLRLYKDGHHHFTDYFHHLCVTDHIVAEKFEIWMKQNHPGEKYIVPFSPARTESPYADGYVRNVLQEIYTDISKDQKKSKKETYEYRQNEKRQVKMSKHELSERIQIHRAYQKFFQRDRKDLDIELLNEEKELENFFYIESIAEFIRKIKHMESENHKLINNFKDWIQSESDKISSPPAYAEVKGIERQPSTPTPSETSMINECIETMMQDFNDDIQTRHKEHTSFKVESEKPKYRSPQKDISSLYNNKSEMIQEFQKQQDKFNALNNCTTELVKDMEKYPEMYNESAAGMIQDFEDELEIDEPEMERDITTPEQNWLDKSPEQPKSQQANDGKFTENQSLKLIHDLMTVKLPTHEIVANFAKEIKENPNVDISGISLEYVQDKNTKTDISRKLNQAVNEGLKELFNDRDSRDATLSEAESHTSEDSYGPNRMMRRARAIIIEGPYGHKQCEPCKSRIKIESKYKAHEKKLKDITFPQWNTLDSFILEAPIDECFWEKADFYAECIKIMKDRAQYLFPLKMMDAKDTIYNMKCIKSAYVNDPEDAAGEGNPDKVTEMDWNDMKTDNPWRTIPVERYATWDDHKTTPHYFINFFWELEYETPTNANLREFKPIHSLNYDFKKLLEDKTQQKVTKEIFLNELLSIFETFKEHSRRQKLRQHHLKKIYQKGSNNEDFEDINFVHKIDKYANEFDNIHSFDTMPIISQKHVNDFHSDFSDQNTQFGRGQRTKNPTVKNQQTSEQSRDNSSTRATVQTTQVTYMPSKIESKKNPILNITKNEKGQYVHVYPEKTKEIQSFSLNYIQPRQHSRNRSVDLRQQKVSYNNIRNNISVPAKKDSRVWENKRSPVKVSWKSPVQLKYGSYDRTRRGSNTRTPSTPRSPSQRRTSPYRPPREIKHNVITKTLVGHTVDGLEIYQDSLVENGKVITKVNPQKNEELFVFVGKQPQNDIPTDPRLKTGTFKRQLKENPVRGRSRESWKNSTRNQSQSRERNLGRDDTWKNYYEKGEHYTRNYSQPRRFSSNPTTSGFAQRFRSASPTKRYRPGKRSRTPSKSPYREPDDDAQIDERWKGRLGPKPPQSPSKRYRSKTWTTTRQNSNLIRCDKNEHLNRKNY